MVSTFMSANEPVYGVEDSSSTGVVTVGCEGERYLGRNMQRCYKYS